MDAYLTGAASKLTGMTGPLIEEDGIYKLPFTVTASHLNFHDTFHGGMQYFYAVEALSQYMVVAGRTGVTMEGSIHYYRPAAEGDRLYACVRERKAGKTVGTYAVEIVREDGTLIADTLFSVMYGRA